MNINILIYDMIFVEYVNKKWYNLLKMKSCNKLIFFYLNVGFLFNIWIFGIVDVFFKWKVCC